LSPDRWIVPLKIASTCKARPADGEIHLALTDATGNKPGIVIAEVRQKRNGARFVIGFQLDAPKDQSNRRKYLPGYAACEIHPVMKLETL
jgi:hypothetical protein